MFFIVPFYVAGEVKNGSGTQSNPDDLVSLARTMDEEMFYIYKYKTAYCPQKNVKHDWAQCIYAHKP